MEKPYSNRLVNESSPYLQQHAHNPVNWYPWGEEALEASRKSDRPILVSIGYAACHWCHVMERESFEDPEVAAYMNEHFVNIKIDREERPDLDMIYMDAVQAITGSGGWPLNVFLNTGAKPFYGGTYFPPVKAYNRNSWKDVLKHIHEAWTNRREEIEKQSAELAGHIARGEQFIVKKITPPDVNVEPFLSAETCDDIAKNLLKNVDEIYGGFGAAPKFPQFFSIQFLLNYGHFFKHEKAMQHAEYSLQKMIRGGIYDQLAGGLSRYSTGADWLVPHFEKMLYDNALLLCTLSDAFRATGKKIYSDAIQQTIAFFITEMKSPEGGFYAALDADSDGEEGKFYVWDKKEVEALLGADADLYCKWFGITERGNWEGRNILHVQADEAGFAEENQITVGELQELLIKGNVILLKERNKRSRPATDDKILLGWNALFLAALCKAAAALGNRHYREEAVKLFDFIISRFCEGGMIRFHTYKNGESRVPAFLDDYAFMIRACILLQEITGGQQYLQYAKTLTEYVITHFGNRETGFFYYTASVQTDIITRKTEVYDGALPSGNSTMAENLYYLSVIFEKEDWHAQAQKMVLNMSEVVVKYPSSFAAWATHLLHLAVGMNELVITGQDTDEIHSELLKKFIPNRVLMVAHEHQPGFPLLEGKVFAGKPLIYLCRNNTCQEPVDSVNSLEMLLKNSIY